MKAVPRARWYIRIFQFSPIVAAALLAAVWLSVPTGLRAQIDSYREYHAVADSTGLHIPADLDERDVAERWFELLRLSPEAGAQIEDVGVAYYDISRDLLEATGVRAEALFSADGEPVPAEWAPEDEMFDAAKEFEGQFGARVYVYTVSNPGMPELTPARVPEGATFDNARSLGNAMWSVDALQGATHSGNLEELPANARPFSDGAAWVMTNMSPESTEQNAPGASDTFNSSATQPQTIVVLATMTESPYAISTTRLAPLTRLWLEVRIFLALQQAPLLGVSSLLLAMALVASPAAFIVERHRITQALVLEEMERVQQDAHDKVYNRLSALSKRVEITGETLSSEVGRSLEEVADDIRDTVTDLQGILGDARQRTASLTGKDLLRSQLESVAREQAARLGITVNLTVSDCMPPLNAQTGWDLQCVLEEAISNAVEHGAATTVIASVDADSDSIRLHVSDNGSGMSAESIEELPKESMGLRGMHNRAERHDGTFTATSTDNGTTIEVRIPLKGALGQ